MVEDPFDPLEEAVERASQRLRDLRAEVRSLREENERLARDLREARSRLRQAERDDERLVALEGEREEVRKRLRLLLERIQEAHVEV